MMRHVLTLLAVSLLCLLLFPWAHAATRTTAELNANHEAVEGRLQLEYPVRSNTANIGYDAMFKEDEYRVTGVEAFLGSSLTRNLDCYIGFRGIYGEVTSLSNDPNISSLGFSAKAEYTFLEDKLGFPLVWGTKLTVSPKPLSFDETEKYWSFRTNLDVNFLQDSGITVGYRYRDADLEKDSLDTSYDESSVFIGYKLTF
jgi:hypothetical protein